MQYGFCLVPKISGRFSNLTFMKMLIKFGETLTPFNSQTCDPRDKTRSKKIRTHQSLVRDDNTDSLLQEENTD
jgi:hypothetical protein